MYPLLGLASATSFGIHNFQCIVDVFTCDLITGLKPVVIGQQPAPAGIIFPRPVLDVRAKDLTHTTLRLERLRNHLGSFGVGVRGIHGHPEALTRGGSGCGSSGKYIVPGMGHCSSSWVQCIRFMFFDPEVVFQ